ncbi:MAG: alpha/beta hydrolase [Atopobiaceae bacterium]|nr:alpha/beta hydrolase [Atopobiaceae bacterium]MBR3383609.1 alpha/beta hydrolase [Atopobiaceae bacterium]
MAISSRILKAAMEAADKKKNEGLTTPEDVVRFDDVVYGTDPTWEVLDVYRPRGAEGALPTIVSVHGGGWVYGDKEVYQFYCMSLAQQGFAVVNYTYPLAPKAKFPSIVAHAAQVLAWCADQADEYGLDVERLFAVGDSAGAHTLAQLAAMLTDAEYAAAVGVPLEGVPTPKAIALNCGIYDIRHITQLRWMLKGMLGDYMPHKWADERVVDLMCVTGHVRESYPPTYLMTSTGDFLVDQAPLMERELEAAGVEHVSKVYGTANNKLGHVFHCDLRLPEAHACNEDECDFFKRFIG